MVGAVTVQNAVIGDGAVTVIHRAVGSSFAGTNPSGLLSIKCMFGGSANYVTDDRQHCRVDDDRYLILNQDQGYTVEKKAQRPVETFCVFFPRGYVQGVAAEASAEPLGNPESSTLAAVDFFEFGRPHRGALSDHLFWVRKAFLRHGLCGERLSLALFTTAEALLREHDAIGARIARLPWQRAATRVELFRRVRIGRDYLHAYFDRPFSLADAARASRLSRYHFLRAFQQIEGVTPLKYVRGVRLARAKARLATTSMRITDIALEVGYESSSAFSMFFRAEAGVSPSAYRRVANAQYR